jgi:hypothetical protein
MAGRDRARFATATVLALGVAIGGYFGSAQLAASTPKAAPRIVTLRFGDVAVFGHLRCGVTSDARSKTRQQQSYYMRCSKRPLTGARYWVDIFPQGISVMDRSTGTQVYRTP